MSFELLPTATHIALLAIPFLSACGDRDKDTGRDNSGIVKLVGEDEEDEAGHTVSGAGDMDGDGYADILVGAPGNGGGGNYAGAAYVLFGPIPADRDLSLADAKLMGEEDSSCAGHSVSGAGDVDGDGFSDILVGAPCMDEGSSYIGATYFFYGPVTADQDLSSADASFMGEHEYALFGRSVSDAGDLDGNGLAGILVGASGDNEGGGWAGAAYLIQFGEMH